jgi:hypothetical protein
MDHKTQTVYYCIFFPVVHQPYSDLDCLTVEVSRSHTDTPHSVGLTLISGFRRMLMRSALFWDITGHRVVILYQHFRTTYQSHPDRSRVQVLGYYAASCGNCLLTFRDKVLVPSSWVKNPTSVSNYHMTPCNIPEEHRSQ